MRKSRKGPPSGILLQKAGDPGRVSMLSVVAKPGRPASHKWGVPKCCIPPNGARGSRQHIIPCLNLEISAWKRIQGPALLENSEDALHLNTEASARATTQPIPSYRAFSWPPDKAQPRFGSGNGGVVMSSNEPTGKAYQQHFPSSMS